MSTSAGTTLTPAAFLVRGLAAGLVAGLLTFVVAFAVGEPHVDRAIAIEEAGSGQAHTHADDAAEHAEEPAQEEAGTVVSRSTQRTWGLLTGTVVIGPALGGLVALAAAAVIGRLGTLSARGSTALVALLGFVAVALVPFLKYPANPPAVGSGDTIGGRTASFFALLLVSVLAMIASVVVARRLATPPEQGGRGVEAWTAAIVAAVGYVAVVSAVALLLPTVDELGDFPASTLWAFRRSSLLTLATLWASIGVVLVVLLGRLHDRASAEVRRRELAASL